MTPGLRWEEAVAAPVENERRFVNSRVKGARYPQASSTLGLINGERGRYLGYAMWSRYPKPAHGYAAAHKDGIVKYTAHELRHVCASLLIASGATDMQTARPRVPLGRP
jgi:hypothetical protein